MPVEDRGATGRSRYVDVLRAAAILRVYLLHTLWLSWLPAVLPAMWVMFALAGYLAAVSLDRGRPLRTVRSRLRRLLPPLWVLALVAVPLMLHLGWHRPDPVALLNWVLPLANPPTSDWGGPFALALWYLRAYVWLVLASPLLWWAFRRWPRTTLLALPTTAVLFYSPLVDLPVNALGDGLWATASYGTCWLLGFARHTGLLDRLSLPVVGAAAAAAALAALGWATLGWATLGWATAHGQHDPLTEMLWGTACVLVLMRLHPGMAWLDRVPWLSAAVTVVNARAVTIYIWHLPATFAAAGLLGASGVAAGVAAGAPPGRLLMLAVTTVLMAGIVLAVGWVEDVAARRPPRLLPLNSPVDPPPSTLPRRPSPVDLAVRQPEKTENPD